MKTRFHGMTKESVFLFLIVSLLLAPSLACSLGAAGPTPTPTPVPPTPTLTPVPPTPTPALVPGIDESIMVEDIKVRILDAYTEESRVNDSGTSFPSNPGDIFFVLEFSVDSFGDRDWIGNNAILFCGNYEYNAVTLVISFGDDGRLQPWQLIFEVAQDLDLETCVFRLNESEIELATFFK